LQNAFYHDRHEGVIFPAFHFVHDHLPPQRLDRQNPLSKAGQWPCLISHLTANIAATQTSDITNAFGPMPPTLIQHFDIPSVIGPVVWLYTL
jgi:hypothetical protein